MAEPVSQTVYPPGNVLRYGQGQLEPIFAPKSVAVIGATETPKSVGRTVFRNLISDASGRTVFPVNPKRPNVLGIKAYPDFKAIGEAVDLAVVVTPAPTVPDIIRECVEAGAKAAVIISAGFKESGPAGAELEQLLVWFSELIVEQHWIKEVDINPLYVSPEGLIALDARVVLHPQGIAEDQLPRLAIPRTPPSTSLPGL